MKILFFGLGSIGQRHLRNLIRIGNFEYFAWRKRNLALPEEFSGIHVTQISKPEDIGKIRPDLCIIAAPPSVQEVLLPLVIGAGCNFFIEKPIATRLDGMEELLRQAEEKKLVTMTGYNLRYHPVHEHLAQLINSNAIGRIVSVRSSVGQYLPDWHPTEDYRLGYSANKNLGGGVILDLIHEIDFVYALFGPVRQIRSLYGKLSSLEISTEDTAELILQFESGVIGSVHLDYVQRFPERNGMIIGEDGTIFYDLLRSDVAITRSKGEMERIHFDFQRNDMYEKEMRNILAAINGKHKIAHDFRAGLAVLRIAINAKNDTI